MAKIDRPDTIDPWVIVEGDRVSAMRKKPEGTEQAKSSGQWALASGGEVIRSSVDPAEAGELAAAMADERGAEVIVLGEGSTKAGDVILRPVMLVAKPEQNADGTQSIRASAQAVLHAHGMGRGVHLDLRYMVSESEARGWTLAVARSGAVRGAIDSVDALRDVAQRWTAEGGTDALRGLTDPVVATRKDAMPKTVLDAEGELDAGDAGALKDSPGFLLVLDRPTVDLGFESDGFTELFVDGKAIDGRIVFRKIPDGAWTAQLPEDQDPYVLSAAAVRKGELPEGRSGLPRNIESNVPTAMRWWAVSGEEALRRRDRWREETWLQQPAESRSTIRQSQDSMLPAALGAVRFTVLRLSLGDGAEITAIDFHVSPGCDARMIVDDSGNWLDIGRVQSRLACSMIDCMGMAGEAEVIDRGAAIIGMVGDGATVNLCSRRKAFSGTRKFRVNGKWWLLC